MNNSDVLVPADQAPDAPELDVDQWFNHDDDLTLASLQGQVVVIEAFQMLCPGCVMDGVPQAQRIEEGFGDQLVVLGLHTVFEHHAAMSPVSLEAFLHEFRVGFPVGVDRADPPHDVPITMRRFGLRGTPSLVMIDRAGRIRFSRVGHVDDLTVGAAIAELLNEGPTTSPLSSTKEQTS